MRIGRFNTEHNEYSDYIISTKPLEIRRVEIYTEPEHTFQDDFYVSEECIILRKYDVESRLGIKLKGLEQIEI